ncbi:hypothetical protein Fcan01_07639 [Folsomia candida]|uniref:Uncharacterized protein n=1 Tax=Folsomia candida TaxID=158441 RepID=A0A226ELK2_FOLCA|nr:hypothetical protein Fcan01_07639 [Folsomia candida]
MSSTCRRNKKDFMELVTYVDMGFGALSVFFSTLIFINSLPLSREGHEFAHDATTTLFMASIFVHFLQLFHAIRLLNSTEHQNFQDNPQESIRLANSWQFWSILFLVLLLVKFYIVYRCYGHSFSFVLYSIFIGLEFCFRIHSRYSVKEFIYEIEMNLSSEYYRWNQ